LATWQPIDWNKILFDLDSWGHKDFINVPTWQIPDWALLQLYKEVSKRRQEEINSYSVSTALLIANVRGMMGGSSDQKVADYLPYQVASEARVPLSPNIVKYLVANRNLLPVACMRLLVENKIIPEELFQ
jgi:hypothetical protein